MAYQSISEQLNKAETALDNALNNQTLLDALDGWMADSAPSPAWLWKTSRSSWKSWASPLRRQ